MTLDEFAFHTPKAKAGILHIRSLPDDVVLGAARSQDSAEFAQIRAFMGERTNPSWITAQAAEEAYMRDLIDEREFDNLTR